MWILVRCYIKSVYENFYVIDVKLKIIVNNCYFKNIFKVLSDVFVKYSLINNIWWPPSLNELTPMIFNMKLTHLDS